MWGFSGRSLGVKHPSRTVFDCLRKEGQAIRFAANAAAAHKRSAAVRRQKPKKKSCN